MGGRGYGDGGRGRLHTYRYTVTTTMTCIKMGSDESRFNVSLIVRDKVTRPCPQTTPSSFHDDNEVMLYVLRCRLTYKGQAVTNAEAWFNKSLRPRKPKGSLGRTAHDGHFDSHTAHELYDSPFMLLLIAFNSAILRSRADSLRPCHTCDSK